MRLLIDGDIIVYRAGFAVEPTIYTCIRENDWHQEFPAGTKKSDIELGDNDVLISRRKPEPVEHALNAAKMLVNSILNRCKYTGYIIYLTSEKNGANFRYEVAKQSPYKGNRKQPKPTHWKAIREYLTSVYGAEIVEDGEADDKLGIEMMKDPKHNVIVTVDKDLDMIPGWHFNFVKDDKYYISEQKAEYNFWFQMLTGDPVDNVKGVPGIGPKKAAKLLKEADPLSEAVIEQYQKYYKENWRDVMTEMGRLLWIRREEGELWQIPKEL